MMSEHGMTWSLAGSVAALTLAMSSALTMDPSGTVIGTVICILLLFRHLGHYGVGMATFNIAALAGLASLTVGNVLLMMPVNVGCDPWLDLFVFSRSVALFAAGGLMTSCALIRGGLRLNPFMFVITIYLTANLLLSLCVLGLLLFDFLSDHVIIIDNRWMMFIISDVFIALGAFTLLLLAIRQHIPLPTNEGAEP